MLTIMSKVIRFSADVYQYIIDQI